jgi:DNA-directed RNA polymerase subunit E"
MPKKVCKNCKIFVSGNECPLCKGNNFTESWQGRINIVDANKSEIAKKIGINTKGEYVLKSR